MNLSPRIRAGPRRSVAAAVTTSLLAIAAIVGGCGDADGGRASAVAKLVTAPSTTAPSTTTSTTTTTTTTTSPPPPPSGGHCIGDSVMLGAGPAGHNALPACAVVDAAVSRQASTLPELASIAAAAHPPFVVIHLGTNGTISPSDLDAALASLADIDRVVIVTVQLAGSRSWEEPNNELLRAAPARFPNSTLADWDAVSEGVEGLLADEFGHLTAVGAAHYALVIAAAIGA